jgi:DNA-binding transcriptional MocR family regulator
MVALHTNRTEEIVDLRRNTIRLAADNSMKNSSLAPEMNWFDSLSPADEQKIEEDAKNATRAFLGNLGVATQPARLELTAGAHHGLYSTLASICKPKGVVVCEALTYPGLKRIAASLGIYLIGVPCDELGLIPHSFESALRENVPQCVFCTPTLQNPTGSTMTAERRIAIADIVRRFNIPLIEDDVYRFLRPNAPPPIFNYAPDVTIYLSSFSKVAEPGIRLGAVIGPEAYLSKIGKVVRATVLQVSPVLCAWLVRAFEAGYLTSTAEEKRVEITKRCALVASRFPRFQEIPNSPHFWIHLSDGSGELCAAAKERGILVPEGADFTVLSLRNSGIRISVGAPETPEALLKAIHVIDTLLTRRTDWVQERPPHLDASGLG